MAFCINCGSELAQGAHFCANCGTAVVVGPVVEPIIKDVVVPVEAPMVEKNINEEQDFLDNTHKLLRWERKAWKICGIVAICLGAVFCLINILVGAYLVGAGIVSVISSGKIPYYLDSLYSDVRPTATRCGNVGMLVLSILFGEVAMVFFLINFIRVKSQGRLINQIEARQKGI